MQAAPDWRAVAAPGIRASVGPGTGIVRSAGTRNETYRASSVLGQDLAGFLPRMTSGNSAVLPAQRLSLDRARDLVRNDPHAQAAVMRLVDMLVGAGWLCIPTPNARALGLQPDQTRDIALSIRSEWGLFTRDPRKFCDLRRKLTMNGLFRLAARTMVTAGEVTGFLSWRPRGGRYATCVTFIDPDRLCNPGRAAETPKLHGGVEHDEDGAPIAYHVRNGHPADYFDTAAASTWTRIERETPAGRPVFIHGFEGDREDQSRAITPFAALVSSLRMIGRHSETELASATANALFAAFITSDLPEGDVAQRLTPGSAIAGGPQAYLEMQLDHLEKNPVHLGGVRVPVLPPGSDFKMNNAPRQTAAFATFQTSFLQAVASAIGLSYEQLAMDWSRTNYSSARAALNEVWRVIKRMQAVFAEQVVQPIYLAWLDEAFDKRLVQAPKGAPDFVDMPEAWCSARWIGPGRGYVDPVKESQASALRMESLTSTLEQENAEQGLDWEETLDQIALENKELETRGLTRMAIADAAATSKITPDSEEVDGAGNSGKGSGG